MLTQIHILLMLVFIVVLLAYILGLVVVKVVDSRLRAIQINIPPSNSSHVQTGGSIEGEEGIGRLPPARGDFDSDLYRSDSRELTYREAQRLKGIDRDLGTQSPRWGTSVSSRAPASQSQSQSQSQNTQGVMGDTLSPSQSQNTQGVMGDTLSPSQGTYFLPLERMTNSQMNRFRRFQGFYLMTLTDYSNWLKLQNPADLDKRHISAYNKVIKGIKLVDSEHPQWHPSPASNTGLVVDNEWLPWAQADLSNAMYTQTGVKEPADDTLSLKDSTGVLDLIRPQLSNSSEKLSSS